MSNIALNVDCLLHVYYARRDFLTCKRLIDRLLYRNLNPEYMFFIKGLIQREEGNNVEALRNLQNALDCNSKNIEIYKEIGRTLYLMGRYKESLNIFHEAEKLSNHLDHESLHYIGELLLRSAFENKCKDLVQKEFEENAKQYFQKAVQTGKKLESFQRLAQIYRKQKLYNKAIEVLENCLQLFPENTDVLTEIGILYLKLNNTQKAFDRLLQVVQFDKNSSKGLMAFGAILQTRNDIDGALRKYKQLATLSPDIPELWNNIGLCFFKKPEQYASAFHTLAAALNLRQDNAECYMLLGFCLRKLDDLDNAYTALETASIMASRGAVDTSQHPAPKAIQNSSNTHFIQNLLIQLNFAIFCYETGRLAMSIQLCNRFIGNMEQLALLPPEYKSKATKLRNLLNISSSPLLINSMEIKPDNGTGIDGGHQQIMASSGKDDEKDATSDSVGV